MQRHSSWPHSIGNHANTQVRVCQHHENANNSDSHLSKRSGTSHHGGLASLEHTDYTIAWICALQTEMEAAKAMLDTIHQPLSTDVDDKNIYVLGSIKGHHVVIGYFPSDVHQTLNSTMAITNMMHSFPKINMGLLVGTGGSVPSKVDVRLGDIVVGTSVLQFDFGKLGGDGQLNCRATKTKPSMSLCTAVTSLRAKHELDSSRVPFILQEKLKRHQEYSLPRVPDWLFHAMCSHKSSKPRCDSCDLSQIVPRSARKPNDVKIHHGAIASGNRVIKNATARDRLGQELDVICFETQAAGVMNVLPCLPILGISNYSDSHESEEWNKYAAATAAAYARELLESIPIHKARSIVSSHDSYQSELKMHRTRLLELLQFDKMSECELEVEMSDAKTCKWLISHPEYQKWLDLAKATVHNGLLWISGKPGAGKSTVMRFAYSAMKNKAHHQQTVVASFFFNNRAGSLQRSPAGMYRALLLQLFEGYPDLLTVLDDMELNPRSRNIRLPLNVLEELFEKAVSTLGRRLFICYVDGLSECDEDQAVEIAYFFEGLAERSAAKHIQFRVCFSARHHPCIPTRTGIRITLENQPGHNEALKDHVTCNLRLSDPALAESIRLEILRKASGMFLWAALVVDSLNKEDRQGGLALIKKLRETPIGLTDLYKDILKRDKDNMEAFQLCMRWILYPKRPLHPKEFYHGLWAGLSPKNLVDPQIPDVSSPATSETLDKFERFVVSSSKGLAEINRSQRPTVRFVHDSVRDFLIQDDGLGEVWPALDIHHEHLGHNTLKQCCNFYLNHQEVHASAKKLASTSHSREKAEILKLYPFLEYVSQYPT